MSGGVLRQVLLVGAGGFVGSTLRFAVSGLVYRLVPFAVFPYGTLAVNVLGCLAIGVLGGLAETRQVIGPELRLFLMIGLLGGFTTFSTFGYETVSLARDLRAATTLGYVGAHLFFCLGATWVGLGVARAW